MAKPNVTWLFNNTANDGANTGNASGGAGDASSNWVVIDLANDQILFLDTQQSDGDSRTGAKYPVIIPSAGDLEAPKTFVDDLSAGVLDQVPLAGTTACGCATITVSACGGRVSASGVVRCTEGSWVRVEIINPCQGAVTSNICFYPYTGDMTCQIYEGAYRYDVWNVLTGEFYWDDFGTDNLCAAWNLGVCSAAPSLCGGGVFDCVDDDFWRRSIISGSAPCMYEKFLWKC